MPNVAEKFATREEWLNEAARMIAEQFDTAFGDEFGQPGVKRLGRLHVSAGFPSQGGLAVKKQVIGQCWQSKASRDKYHHVFISPLLDDAVIVVATLAHEMAHAADDGEHGHKGAFTRAVRKIGLEGKPTATVAGPEFAAWVKKTVVPALGKYPHVALVPTMKAKTQKTYMVKVVCPEDDCVIRMTRKHIDTSGLPTCGCGGQMEEA